LTGVGGRGRVGRGGTRAGERAIETVVGERLRNLRIQRGFTQRALARRVEGGVDLSYISRIERGDQLPSLKVLQKLGRALDVSLREFFDPQPMSRSAESRVVSQALWRTLLRVPPQDLPILLAVIRVLTRRRGVRSRYPESQLARKAAAERRGRYRTKGTDRRPTR
jgi:transcriptional regulator with XRE-family HTH domain